MLSNLSARVKWILALSAGAVLLSAVVSWRRLLPVDGSKAAPSASSAYVASTVCGLCHPAIATTYRLTGMARSFSRVTSGVVSGAEVRIHHALSERDYAIFEREGRLYERRHQTDFDGNEAAVVERAADFVIGSGNHARTFLHRNSQGRLLEMPVSWYAENGGTWAMSPGYDRPRHQDFRRAISHECMFCHNAYPEAGPRSADADSESVFPEKLPEGIDCQRCHGPGGAHVQLASARASIDQIRRAIVNPARLGRDRQLETCMQCHLETSSSPLPHSIARYDRGPYSYRPGEPLGGAFLYFDHAQGSGRDQKFEIAGAAYQLRASACFRASNLTCTTCHNPHEIPRGDAAVRHYVAVCTKCHESAHPSGAPAVKGMASGASCLDCHMPKRRTEDAVHVVMTDHFISRRPPTGNLLAARGEPTDPEKSRYHGEVVSYYPPQPPSSPEADLYLAVAQVKDESNLESGIPRLEQAITTHKPSRPDFYYELGRAYSKAGKSEQAVHWLEEALKRRGDFLPAKKDLAGALVARGELARAASVLEQAGNESPVLTDLGNTYLRLGRAEQAASTLRRALAADPDSAEAANLLGLAELARGNRVAAEQQFRAAIAIQPDLVEAHNNLANLLAGARQYREAAFHYEQAVRYEPSYVEAYHSYGMLLILIRAYDRAESELAEAARLAPGDAQIHVDLADLLGATGRAARAIDEYRTAIRLNPNHYEAHLSLGGILARERNPEARSHFQKALESPDPEVRAAAAKALQ